MDEWEIRAFPYQIFFQKEYPLGVSYVVAAHCLWQYQLTTHLSGTLHELVNQALRLRVEVSVTAINVIICSRLLIDVISTTTVGSHYREKSCKKHKHFYFCGWFISYLLYKLGLPFMGSDLCPLRGSGGTSCRSWWKGWRFFLLYQRIGCQAWHILPTSPWVWRIDRSTWLPKMLWIGGLRGLEPQAGCVGELKTHCGFCSCQGRQMEFTLAPKYL